MFPGFHRPRSNFHRLPNEWFARWRAARAARAGGRIVGPLKATEYVIKWSWGYQNFDRPVRISWHHFQYGRVVGKARLDRGTGLSSRILGEALDTAVELGFLKRHGDAKQPTYLPHLRPAAEDAAGFLAEDPDIATAGFAPPNANYFQVPAIWTDLTSDVSSEVLILAVEYLFRHTWGWEGGWERPCWLTAEEIAAGRRYRSAARQGERYDEGIGYSERALRDALADGVKRGWLVWQEMESGGRVYALHLKGMQVAEDGRFLGMTGEVADERAPLEVPTPPLPPAPCAAPFPEPSGVAEPARLTQLEAQVRALTQEVQALTAALDGLGLALPTQASSTVGAEESKAAPEQSKAATAESKAGAGGKYSTSYTDTPDTSQTPAPDTRGARPVAVGGGGVDALPEDLRQLLAGLDFRGRRPLVELATAYQADPARVGGWIRYLDGHRSEFQQPAGYLLQSVVRDGEAGRQVIVDRPQRPDERAGARRDETLGPAAQAGQAEAALAGVTGVDEDERPSAQQTALAVTRELAGCQEAVGQLQLGFVGIGQVEVAVAGEVEELSLPGAERLKRLVHSLHGIGHRQARHNSRQLGEIAGLDAGGLEVGRRADHHGPSQCELRGCCCA